MKKKLIHVLVVFLTVTLCYILQSSVLPDIAGVSPNLIVIEAASFGLLLGEKEGIVIGFFSGLLCDIFFGPLIGFGALMFALIGYVCGTFKRLLYVDGLAFSLLLIGISDFCYCYFSYFFLFLIRNRLFLGSFFTLVMLPELLLTMLLALPVYPLIHLCYNRFLREKHASPQTGGKDALIL